MSGMTREPSPGLPNHQCMRRISRMIRTVVIGSTVAVALGALACVSPAPPLRPGPGSTPPDLAAVATELVAAHNRVRAAHHRGPLKVNGALEAAALTHANDMARRRWMSHRGGDGSSPFRRMAAQGYTFQRAGENVAAGYASVDSVMSGWMHSPGHRHNILGKFTEIGAACATANNGTIYWCVTFGDPPTQ
jgi:uncharacterized protein YkwD